MHGMATTSKDQIPCPDPEDQATVTVDDAARIIGISRGSMYRAIDRGEIPIVRVGKRVLIPTATLRRMLHLDDPATMCAGHPGAA